MVQACREKYTTYDQSGKLCSGFSIGQCCDGGGLGARYPDKIFGNIPSAAQPA